MKFLVTGSHGFIGSQLVRTAHAAGHSIIALDNFTYAGRKENVPDELLSHTFRGSICNAHLVRRILRHGRPDAIFNFAAESHVDRSIQDAKRFISTNVRGTHVLLREALTFWESQGRPAAFRFIQISTDEVFGDLGPNDPPFSECSPIRPNSPYAASKAAADHFVSSFAHTYGLPTVITRCSNNYGPRQYPEKLIPYAVSCFLSGRPFGLHGTGENVRDWISVEDHCAGLLAAYDRGTPGEGYCFGGSAERTNNEVLRVIQSIIGRGEIVRVTDRPGNDRRYAIDFRKATAELNWRPRDNFEEGLKRTVTWYQEHPEWLTSLHM